MVREIRCTAPGSATMTDWNSDTGINSTSQRDSAMKSASTASPVISAISLNVSPAFSCPSDCRAPPSPSDRGSHRAAQHDAEVRGFLAPVGNRFIGFERNDARAIDQLLQAFGGEVLEQSYLFLEKCLWVHGFGVRVFIHFGKTPGRCPRKESSRWSCPERSWRSRCPAGRSA